MRKRLVKLFVKLFVVLLLLITVSITGLFINHQTKLKAEADDYAPPGEIVEVNGTRLHFYAEGEGDHTLVFLAGHGTSYPTLDFKPLWREFVDEYRIVVERPGYGFSEKSIYPRDIATILEETRTALGLVGEDGPYVLLPHSMAGLEAIYWAQKYPEEITAVIGLDPLLPTSVDLLPDIPKLQLNMTYFISRIGLSRLMPETELTSTLPLLQSDILSETEKETYKALFYKCSLSKNMMDELDYIHQNAQTILDLEAPTEIPMYFFVSSEQNDAVSGWKAAITEYASSLMIGEVLELSTSHYVHHDEAALIASETKSFLDAILQS